VRLRRLILLSTIGSGLAVATAGPAAACGGLVGENGSIQLVRTATLAAYHDGVEHYVTSFEFTGQGEEVGTIVPLPGVPTSVERGGDWTLQRLSLEVAPPLADRAFGAESAEASRTADVLLETQIDALEITVLEGGGDEVGRWALDHGFLLTPDAPEVLDYYAERSPIFMAARFDASVASQLGQNAGDGTPIHLTIPTEDPWVPLRILGLGLDQGERVEADVFLLTDARPRLLAGGDGLDLERSGPASDFLLDDLRSDSGMEWVPDDFWLSYLQLDVEAGQLDYDLAVATDGESPSPVAAGLVSPTDATDIAAAFRTLDSSLPPPASDDPRWTDVVPFAALAVVTVILLGGVVVGTGAWSTARARRRTLTGDEHRP
jgi:Uncharacterized protein conserved in bacteria (DUF2330)